MFENQLRFGTLGQDVWIVDYCLCDQVSATDEIVDQAAGTDKVKISTRDWHDRAKHTPVKIEDAAPLVPERSRFRDKLSHLGFVLNIGIPGQALPAPAFAVIRAACN